MSWRCAHCGHRIGPHIYDHGALICPPDDEPKDDE
jgi:hypothetical protein